MSRDALGQPAGGLRVLLLAGTQEARELAAQLAGEPGIATTASLAGVTQAPAAYAVPLRLGGFGGTQGLARHLLESGTHVLVDATHPFAARISANAQAAAAIAGVPLLRLERPEWREEDEERWRRVATVEAAADCLPTGAHVFLATGPGSLAAFARRPDLRLVLRAISAPVLPPHPDLKVELARPPFEESDERAMFARHDITHLVTKNAGGVSGRTKLAAAQALGLEVVMIDRPVPPPPLPPPPPPLPIPPVVATPFAALGWLRAYRTGKPSRALDNDGSRAAL
ncbi:MAG: cobalt-precorrin-6A reductase [Pikeienuella sp.]